MQDWGAKTVLLVKRVQEGSSPALEELYKLSLPRVQSYLRSRAPDLSLHDLDDLCQDVMIVAVRDLAKLRRESSFPAWLLRIARNKLLNWFRDKAHSDLRTFDNDVPSQQPDPEAELKQRERLELLRKCIGELTENQRAVIILHYYHNLKVKEISSLLEKPAGTVAPVLMQARERIKKCLQTRTQMK